MSDFGDAWVWNNACRGEAEALAWFQRELKLRRKTIDGKQYSAYWKAVCLLLRELAESRKENAARCAQWFEPVEPGRYAVRAVGPAGCEYDAPSGFHYPCQAFAAAERFKASNPDLVVFVVDTEDPERGALDEDDDDDTPITWIIQVGDEQPIMVPG